MSAKRLQMKKRLRRISRAILMKTLMELWLIWSIFVYRKVFVIKGTLDIISVF